VSLASSRLIFVHRCAIERNTNLGSDDGWGNPLPPSWESHLEDQPCFSWPASQRAVSHEGTLTAVLIEVKLLLPLGTDVTEGDRIDAISDRGEPLYGGPLSIHAVLPRRDHIELILSKAA
jgi:hypothetical protein